MKQKHDETREVQVAETQALTGGAPNFPSFFQDDIAPDKVVIPRLELLQAQSDSVQLLGHRVGTYEHSLTKDNYGDTIKLVPVKPSFGAVYMTTDKIKIDGKEKNGFICRSDDQVTNMFGNPCAKCEFGVSFKWAQDGSKPKCSETANLIAITPDGSPVILTTKNNSYKAGKRLINAIWASKQLRTCVITSALEQNDKGKFYVVKVKETPLATADEYAQAVKLRQQIENKGVSVQSEETEE